MCKEDLHDTKLQPRKNILYAILPVTWFSINFNKNHKSRLNSEIKYNLYKIAKLYAKNFLEKTVKLERLSFLNGFKSLKTYVFAKSFFPALDTADISR